MENAGDQQNRIKKTGEAPKSKLCPIDPELFRFIQALAIADAKRDHAAQNGLTSKCEALNQARRRAIGASTHDARRFTQDFRRNFRMKKSTEDQIVLCRIHAERRGFDVVAIYEDKARSGASVFGRDGLMHLMDAAREHAFDVVMVEALDRLSRDMEDLAGLHKRLSYLGIEIHAVHDGMADSIMIGIRGLVGQMQREDGAKKVRRGMAGVIRDGRHAGGRAYGYRPVPGQPGEMQIIPDEAEIVQRILAEYADGRPPREIASRLNKNGIAPPRGTLWNASTINGNAQRGTGVIFNELYAGRIVWNKVRMVKNPDTGKRISRPNPRDQWQSIEVPALRLVDDQTWEQVQNLKAAKAKLNSMAKRRSPHLLSGLLRCGCCGSGMSVHDRDKTGKTRIRCSAVRESGRCSNHRIFYVNDIEEAVFGGMADELKDPRLIETYVRSYNEERQRLAASATKTRKQLEGKRDRMTSERANN